MCVMKNNNDCRFVLDFPDNSVVVLQPMLMIEKGAELEHHNCKICSMIAQPLKNWATTLVSFHQVGGQETCKRG